MENHKPILMTYNKEKPSGYSRTRAFQGSVILALLVVLAVTFFNFGIGISNHELSRRSFPDGFVFGTGSSAYQYEGAATEDGKGLSIWDTFTHRTPDKIANNSNGDVAIDFYHRYKEDVKLMKYIGLDAFRISISWPRLLPYGKVSGGINKEGVAFYNNLINELLTNGIEPFVSLFHWDVPQALEDEYGGFLSPQIVDNLIVNKYEIVANGFDPTSLGFCNLEDFRDFADVCYKEFGDRVKYWITVNEPLAFIKLGYDSGELAPGRCSSWKIPSCPAGDSDTEPYIVGHYFILSHAAAYRIYKEKYQASQKGQIGISLVTPWMMPSSDAESDKDAARIQLDYTYGWYMHPLTYGDYPKSMREIIGNRLPKFSDIEAKLVMGSLDFLGINYYFAVSVTANDSATSSNLSYSTDNRVNQTFLQDEKLKHKGMKDTMYPMYPEGLKDLLVYTKKEYGDPTIYITENGMADTFVATVEEGVNDFKRINFYKRHLLSLRGAIEAGVKVKGFFAWSFLDNFEWDKGYNARYGMGYVDYNDGLKRYLKRSAMWFKNILLRY